MGTMFLKRYRSIIVLLLVLLIVAGFVIYIWTAPPLERQDLSDKILFSDEVFVRRKPSDEARPWARTKDGVRLEILSEEGEWLKVRLDESTEGWVRRDQGQIVPPPYRHPTPRQQAKQRAQQAIRAFKMMW